MCLFITVFHKHAYIFESFLLAHEPRAGLDAGATTILIGEESSVHFQRARDLAHYTVRSLADVIEFVRSINGAA